MKFKLIPLALICLSIMACSSMELGDFDNTTPKFVPEEYFKGKLTAYGLVKNRSGQITRTFKGDLVGHWDENGVGTLEEDFVYDDGEELRRVWTLTPNGENTYIGTAGDIVGEAPMQVNGNTLKIDYTMLVPYDGDTIEIDVVDWLHLQEDGVILNHSKMTKFGVEVGELVITIIKHP